MNLYQSLWFFEKNIVIYASICLLHENMIIINTFPVLCHVCSEWAYVILLLYHWNRWSNNIFNFFLTSAVRCFQHLANKTILCHFHDSPLCHSFPTQNLCCQEAARDEGEVLCFLNCSVSNILWKAQVCHLRLREGKQVSWCFTPSQPVQLYQGKGENKGQLQSSKRAWVGKTQVKSHF